MKENIQSKFGDVYSMNEKDINKQGKTYYLIGGLLLLFPILEIVALILWVPGTWNERLTGVLAIIGIYGLAISFFRNAATMKSYMEDLTSPNILIFIRGNFLFLSLLMALVSAGIDPEKKPGYPVVLWIIGNIFSIAFAAIVFIYAIFHLLVVVMISYLPMVIASAIVSQIIYADKDIEMTVQHQNGSKESMHVCDVIRNNVIASKGFLVGLPASVISLVTAISTPFIG